MLPERFMLHLLDMPLADLLIVMGTSLEVGQSKYTSNVLQGRVVIRCLFVCLFVFKVHPFAGIVDYVNEKTPRLLINKEVVGPFFVDPRENDNIYKGRQVLLYLKVYITLLSIIIVSKDFKAFQAMS